MIPWNACDVSVLLLSQSGEGPFRSDWPINTGGLSGSGGAPSYSGKKGKGRHYVSTHFIRFVFLVFFALSWFLSCNHDHSSLPAAILFSIPRESRVGQEGSVL